MHVWGWGQAHPGYVMERGSTFGLGTGELVVTTGQLKLNPGATIHIDKSQALSPPRDRPKL